MTKRGIATLALSAHLLAGYGSATAADGIEMPGVGDMTLAEAETALAEAGIEDFTVDAGPQSNPQDNWIVTSTRPIGGRDVGDGDVVVMVRSEGFLEQSEAGALALEESRAAAAAQAEAKRQAAAEKAAEEERKEAAAKAKAKAKAEAKKKAEALKPAVYEGYAPTSSKLRRKTSGHSRPGSRTPAIATSR